MKKERESLTRPSSSNALTVFGDLTFFSKKHNAKQTGAKPRSGLASQRPTGASAAHC
tara:strand:+ start:2710 stop:2880 length:171 start_codon:yes stop_codon:yes gene_type:complete